ncbi:MAG: HAD hydrolase-like protein, partial [Gemmatimonadota bacterium]|nr:HAD hydrolase-like protein [Gemmatimonadota bacterium]
ADEILTAPAAAARWLRGEGIRRVCALVPDATCDDLAEFELTDEAAETDGTPEPDTAAEVVLVGDLGRAFDFDRLNRAFLALRAGARLVAIHRNRYWISDGGPTLDAGPFVAALEYAAGVEAVLVGKPAPTFFAMAAADLGLPVDQLAVVGDDAESDVRGGRRAGTMTVQVRTGKGAAATSPERTPEELRPDRIVASLAEIPALFGVGGGA